ncbi:MAG: PH domain-containing protein, partial [Syntrophomonadaceae bacterium]|nr:PH domain-containing protein [Syntrophomonadaceae bacterium]
FWGIKQYRDAGWQIIGDQIAVRYRVFGLNTFLVKRIKVQSIELQQNPLQKRRNLKAFVIRIASSVGGTKISLKGIDEEDGDKIMGWVNKRMK